MSLRKASKREIQKDERRTVVSKPASVSEPTATKEPVAVTMPEPRVSKKPKTGNHKKFSKSGFLM